MKGLLSLAAAALAVAALAWFVHRREAGSWQEQALPAGAGLLAGVPVNDVALVRLQGTDGAVTLRRTADGWVVAERAGYAADFDKVSGLVRRLVDLTAVQSLPLAASDQGALQLREPGPGAPPGEAAMVIELQDPAGRPLGSVLLGKPHVTAPAGVRPDVGGAVTGRFVRAAADPAHAYLVGEAFSDVRPAPSDWVRQDFVRPAAARRIEVRGGDPKSSWTIEREAAGAPWTLAGGTKNGNVDPAKLLNLDAVLSALVAADVPDGPGDPRLKPLDEKPVTVVVDSFDGLRHTLVFGAGGGDNLPARIAVEELPSAPADRAQARGEALAAAAKFRDTAVFIPRSFLQPFLQERAALLVAPPVPAPAAEPAPTPGRKKKR